MLEVGLLLDPEIAALLPSAPRLDLAAEMLPALRQQPLVTPVALSDDVERSDITVPGAPSADGRDPDVTDPDVIVRLHRPKGVEGPLPCVYSIHGGGYIMGSYRSEDARFDSWSPRFGCVGASVEYRLAPERPTRGRWRTVTPG